MKTLIFDTETTGLVKNSLVPLESQPRIIEMFMHTVDSDSGEVLNEIEFLCDPGIIIDKDITRITGIKPEDLVGKQPFSHYAGKVLELVEEADAILAHNLSFDLWLLECEIVRSTICLKEGQINWPSRKICTVEATEFLHGHRLSLSALHEELFGEPFSGAHRARTDVEALTRVYLELVKRGDL